MKSSIFHKLRNPLFDQSGQVRGLNKNQNTNLGYFESQLQQYWHLGRNIVISWCAESNGIQLVIVPYYVVEPLTTDNSRAFNILKVNDIRLPDTNIPESFLKTLISGTRQVSSSTLEQLAHIFDVETLRIELPHQNKKDRLDTTTIDDIVQRYSISYVENRAVILIDIVGFSIHDPFIQAMQLNGLAYSINSAHSKLLNKDLNVDFARSTTGDGFYLWNRDNSMQGNIDLYFLLKLVLADNAIARQMSVGESTPELKTAFHIGDCYEFYQAEGLRPTRYNYIVGDVTIELARLIDKAIPGQLLVGDFETSVDSGNKPGPAVKTDTITFINKLRGVLDNLNGVELSGEKINSIQCYLTGTKILEDEFTISKYKIADKHGMSRYAYNAKTNIYREHGPPIYLGIQESHLLGLDKIQVKVR